MRPFKLLLALILVCFFALALVYNIISPPFENSDEVFHFPLIKYLADKNLALPVQDPDHPQLWLQQGSQPPLYHIIAALLIKPLDTSDFLTTYRLNPHARIGIVTEGNTNNNMVIHPLDRFPADATGSGLAVHLIRVFSTLLAAVVVVGTYYLTVLTFPHLPHWVGLLAAALVAFNPMYLFVASSINNDNLANAIIMCVAVWLTWLYRRDDRPTARHLLLIGVLLGLGLVSKLSVGPFMLVVGLYWLGIAIKFHLFPYMIKWGCASLGVALLIGGWWYVRNHHYYGDFTGLNTFLDIVGRRPVELTPEQLWSERHVFDRTFWGLFGALTVDIPAWLYTVFNILAATSVIGLLIYFVPAMTKLGAQRRLDVPQVAVVMWPVLSFLSVIRWTWMTPASQGRLWFVAIGMLAALSAVGFYEIGRRLSMLPVAWIPVGFTASIAGIVPFAVLTPAYAPPKLFAMSQASPPVVVFNDPDYVGESIALTHIDFPNPLAVGTEKEFELEFCALTALSRNWSVFVHLVNAWDIIVAQADFTPGYGKLPTAEMAAGQCWRDRFPMIRLM